LKQIRKRLTYANVMSSMAVFLVLGGATAFAASQKIGANRLKANSVKTGKIVKEAVVTGKIKNGAVTESKLADGAVTTNKIADNAVTGAKVNEATLGQVPSAANANSVGGNSVKKFFYASNASGTVQTILTLNGLTLTASCPGGELTANATTAVDDSMIHSGGAWLAGTEVFYDEDDSFDTGNNFDFLVDGTTASDSVQGTLTYAQPNGTVVTAVFAGEEDSLDVDCVVSGYATG
jgi:hypothetical protein